MSPGVTKAVLGLLAAIAIPLATEAARQLLEAASKR